MNPLGVQDSEKGEEGANLPSPGFADRQRSAPHKATAMVTPWQSSPHSANPARRAKVSGPSVCRPSRKHERIRRPTEAGAEFRRKAEYMRKRDTRATCRSLKDREPGMAVSGTRAKRLPYGLSQRLL